MALTFDPAADGGPEHDALVHAAGHEHVQVVAADEVRHDVRVPRHLEQDAACVREEYKVMGKGE